MTAGLPKWCRAESVVHFIKCLSHYSRCLIAALFSFITTCLAHGLLHGFAWRRPVLVPIPLSRSQTHRAHTPSPIRNFLR